MFGQGDAGIRFPRQRLPGALRGGQGDAEKPFSLRPGLRQISLREPKFGEARFQWHPPVPVVQVAPAIHVVPGREEVLTSKLVFSQSRFRRTSQNQRLLERPGILVWRAGPARSIGSRTKGTAEPQIFTTPAKSQAWRCSHALQSSKVHGRKT